MTLEEANKIYGAYERFLKAVEDRDLIENKTWFGTECGIKVSAEDYDTLYPLFFAKCLRRYEVGDGVLLTNHNNRVFGHSFHDYVDGAKYYGIVPCFEHASDITIPLADMREMALLILCHHNQIETENFYKDRGNDLSINQFYAAD